MKTVHEDEYRARMRPSPSKQTPPEKIGGGNRGNIPSRNYNEMLHSKGTGGGTRSPAPQQTDSVVSTVTTKPPLMDYLENEQRTKPRQATEPEVVASGIDPQNIPQRDYDQMLNAMDIDDSAAFIPDHSDTDITMNENTTIPDPSAVVHSTVPTVIPQRDYESMLNAPEPEYDAESEQQQLIEEMTQRLVAQQQNESVSKEAEPSKLTSYRSERAVVPKRNYEAMMRSNALETSADVSSGKTDRNLTSSTGQWVCSNPECEHLNRATRMDCSVCHTVKASYKRTAQLLDDSVDQLGLDHRWVCKGCNGLNKGSRSKCVYCKETKSYDPKSKSAAKKQVESTKKKRKRDGNGGIFQDTERWVCPNAECNFLNKGSRLNCQVCKTVRKDQDVLWGDRAKPSQEVVENKSFVSDSGSKVVNKTFVHPLEAKLNGGTMKEAPQWNCAMCTFANRCNAAKCEMCGCPKDAH